MGDRVQTGSMIKVLIIGSGDRTEAIALAKQKLGDDIYIIPQKEEANYQFRSDYIPFTAPRLVINHIMPVKDGKAKRRERRAMERKKKHYR